MINHRNDVDGLRAIAILAVVLYHFEFPFAYAGFAGVDMFFVISGFLICGTSLREISTLAHVGDFYRRRVARLLPMLLLTTVLVLAATAVWSLSVEARLTYKAAKWAILFLANHHFWEKADYFNAQGSMNPLLPTWSLGVEEQFYLIIPFVFLFLGKWKKHVLVWGAVVSFSLASFVAQPPGAFYLLPCRGWELSVGALVALSPRVKDSILGGVLAASGLILLSCSFIFMSPGFEAPVWLRILPVFGTALLIATGENPGFVKRIMGWSPLTRIGSISYSAYLIHWPLWIFISRPAERFASLPEKVGLVLLTFALALATNRYVEEPCRRLMRSWSLKRIVLSLVVSIGLVFGVVSMLIPLTPWEPESREAPMGVSPCYLSIFQKPEVYSWNECVPKGEGRKWLLWGDSHAAHYFEGLQAVAPESVAVFQATYAGCSLLGLELATYDCRRFHDETVASIIEKVAPELVIVSGFWSREVDRYGIDRTVDRLREKIAWVRSRGARVVVVLHGPVFARNVRSILDREKYSSESRETYEYRASTFSEVNERLRTICDGGSVVCVDPISVLCRDGVCVAARGGKKYFVDESHLSNDGAELLMREFVAQFD